MTRLWGEGGMNQAASHSEFPVAQFCFNQAVRFANVLPEVPSPKTSSLPCVLNYHSVSVFQFKYHWLTL